MRTRQHITQQSAKQAPTREAAREDVGARETTTEDVVRSLHSSAGNQAVADLLGRSSGEPLDSETRESMEAQFGFDFENVRIHKDHKAQETALRAGARAIASGNDILFAPDLYAPSTAEGRLLLAHELAHVVQQQLGQSASHAEAEADARSAASDAVSGNPPTVQSAAAAPAQADPLTKEQLEKMIADNEAQAANAGSEELKALERDREALIARWDEASAAPATPVVKAEPPPPAPAEKTESPKSETSPPQPSTQPPDMTIEQFEGVYFDPLNPQASRNLMLTIEALGGSSYDITKVPYATLMKEYRRLKEAKMGKPYEGPSWDVAKPGGVPLAEIERRQKLAWENLARYEKEPGAWIATGTMIYGTPDEQSKALDTASVLTGFAATGGAIAEHRAANEAIGKSGNLDEPAPKVAPAAKTEPPTKVDETPDVTFKGTGGGGSWKISLNIDEPLAVGEKGISQAEAMRRATDLKNRQFLNFMTNQGTKREFAEVPSPAKGTPNLSPTSVADNPSALITRPSLGGIKEWDDLSAIVMQKVGPSLKGKSPQQAKEILNRAIREELKDPKTAPGKAISDALVKQLGIPREQLFAKKKAGQ